MARPPSIKDETILEAARQVFLERGIVATTAEVAERAGISEGSIFKRYKSKHELFRAAMGETVIVVPTWVEKLPGLVGKGDVKENLVALGIEIVEFFRELLPTMMMSWSNPGTGGLPAALSGPNPPPLRALKQLTGLFEAEMRAGRLRRHDPEVVARAFIGGLNSYAFLEVVLRASDELPLAVETYVRGFVNLLWAGIEPSP